MKYIFIIIFFLLPQQVLSHEIEIKGSEKFKKQVTKALVLMKLRAPDAYQVAIKYIGRIEQGEHSGMWAYKQPPTYEINDKTAFYSVTWCAGSIAHDSIHSKFFHEYSKNHTGPVPGNIWTGKDAENKSIKHQLNVLMKINAPKHEIDYCRNLKGTHHDANRDGKYDWEDYKKRNW